MTFSNFGRASEEDQWFRYWMPYAFEPLKHPTRKHVFLPLNRNYKPLGVTSKEHVDYNKYIEQAMVFKSDPFAFKDVWYSTEYHLFLYSDNLESRSDYFPRLRKLFSRSIQLVSKAIEAD